MATYADFNSSRNDVIRPSTECNSDFHVELLNSSLDTCASFGKRIILLSYVLCVFILILPKIQERPKHLAFETAYLMNDNSCNL